MTRQETRYLRFFATDSDGRHLPIIYPNTDEAIRGSGLFMILADLAFCQQGFRHLLSTYSTCVEITQKIEGSMAEPGLHPVLFGARAAWFSSVITYGKCFARADGRQVLLAEKKYVKPLGQPYLDCHQKLIDDRHKFIAHAGKSLNEAGRIGYVIRHQWPIDAEARYFYLRATLPSKEHIELAEELSSKLIASVDAEIDRLLKKLGAEILNLPREQIEDVIRRSQQS